MLHATNNLDDLHNHPPGQDTCKIEIQKNFGTENHQLEKIDWKDR